MIDSVIFCGSIPNPYPLMKRAKMILLSSFSEALPTVILEAFALGKTMVSTPTQGAKELLGQEVLGYLSKDFNNKHSFAEKIIQAYKNPIDPVMLFSNALNFTVDNKVIELSALF